KLSEVFADPHIVARECVVEMEHASGATVKVIANPVRLSATPPTYRAAPPTLGQHSDEVLRELGLTVEEIATLRAAGVV
ncbi:MAG TPA: CoA transferase, partial [Roseomonas sp.]